MRISRTESSVEAVDFFYRIIGRFLDRILDRIIRRFLDRIIRRFLDTFFDRIIRRFLDRYTFPKSIL